MIELPALIQWVTSGGTLTVLIVILWAGAKSKPWWVFGEAHRSAIADRDKQIAASKAECAEWKQLALRSTMLADRAADQATRAILPARPRGGRASANPSAPPD